MNTSAGLPFPHVSQAYLIERHVTALDGTPLPDVAALGEPAADTRHRRALWHAQTAKIAP